MPVEILEIQSVRKQAYKISVDLYHTLYETGQIKENVELIEGVIIKKMPKSPLHSYIVSSLYQLLAAIPEKNWQVRQEQPLTLEQSEPEPDIALVAIEDYSKRHPRTAQLIIEIALSSLPLDREKSSIYAKALVSEYLIINVLEKSAELYSQPLDGSYQQKKEFLLHETINIEFNKQIAFQLSDFL